ncbi:hypothetical protein SAMN04488514_101957 [Kriegella aquimaris]|uniref:Uncharacterized protein n=1 Tax=Kriegella aquimaris TaxID=192904 RepID=A0A1G9KDX7_9FLAO|nr:hypothetical protein SAMN04488514_101957 [Kriegella aquimaris]
MSYFSVIAFICKEYIAHFFAVFLIKKTTWKMIHFTILFYGVKTIHRHYNVIGLKLFVF